MPGSFVRLIQEPVIGEGYWRLVESDRVENAHVANLAPRPYYPASAEIFAGGVIV